MIYKELQEDAARSDKLMPRWLRISGAVRYSSVSRSLLYQWIATGKVRSISLKSNRGNVRGVRLIDRLSIDELMLQGLAKDKEATQSPVMPSQLASVQE